MDRLAALRVFRQVAELSSFAGAGRRLGLSPPAVSKAIGGLEARLGVRLIDRTTRRMSLTEAGTLYLGQIARILDELDEADRALGPLQKGPTGLLRVTAPLTVGVVYLGHALPDFLRRHPDLSIDLRLDDRRLDLVAEGFDLAVRASDRLEDTSLVARKLAVLRHVVCAAPAYLDAAGAPTRPDDLALHRCIAFTLSGHADRWTFTRAGRTVAVPIGGRYRVSSSLAVRDALIAGFGLSLIPRAFVESDLRAGRLRAVLDDWESVATTLYAVYPSRRYPAPKLRVVLDFLIETFADPPPGGIATHVPAPI